MKVEELTSDRIKEVHGADHTSIFLEFPNENQVMNENLSLLETEERHSDDD